MSAPMQTAIANGDIFPCRFVKLVSAKPGRVAQCGAGDQIWGISQQGIRLSPLLETQVPARAAAVNESLGVFDDNEFCLLELGGTVAVGDRLKSDANGKGVTTVTDLDEYGAIAYEAGVAGRQIRVKVQRGQQSHS